MNEALWYFHLIQFYYIIILEKKDLDQQNWFHDPQIGQHLQFVKSGLVPMKIHSRCPVSLFSLGFSSVPQIRTPLTTVSSSNCPHKCCPRLVGSSMSLVPFIMPGGFHQSWTSWRSLPNRSLAIFWKEPRAIITQACWQPVLLISASRSSLHLSVIMGPNRLPEHEISGKKKKNKQNSKRNIHCRKWSPQDKVAEPYWLRVSAAWCSWAES